MAEPTVLLKIVGTDLVLRMLEDRFPLTSLNIVSVPQALRAISHDMSGSAAFETADGQRYTALSVQRHCTVATTAVLIPRLTGLLRKNC